MKNKITVSTCSSVKVTDIKNNANNPKELYWPDIFGKTGPLFSASSLAFKYINKAKIIRAAQVNKVLAFADISITQSQLDKILRGTRLEFLKPDYNTIRSDVFLENVGTVRGSVQVPGVYIWTHLSTNDKYVGSSSILARRLIGYFNCTHKSTGKLIPLIKSEGLGAFKLEVIPLKESYVINQELSLEQYLLLHPEFNLNTLKVVNNFSGARAKPLYMYTKDLSELVYFSNVQEDFIFKLGIHHSIFSKSLRTGSHYLDKYVFSDKPVIHAKENNMPLRDINSMLNKDRLNIQNTKGRKIRLTAIDDNNNTKLFFSISNCVQYLNMIVPSNKTSLYRCINLGKPYQGYICPWESDKASPITSRSILVIITHVFTGKIETFSSFRKAALSFAPEYTTTGSTLKIFAEKGKLFNGKYKIIFYC